MSSSRGSSRAPSLSPYDYGLRSGQQLGVSSPYADGANFPSRSVSRSRAATPVRSAEDEARMRRYGPEKKMLGISLQKQLVGSGKGNMSKSINVITGAAYSVGNNSGYDIKSLDYFINSLHDVV